MTRGGSVPLSFRSPVYPSDGGYVIPQIGLHVVPGRRPLGGRRVCVF